MKFMSAAYKKEMQGQLKTAAKGSGWRQSKGVVYRQCGEWFIAGHWRNVGADPGQGLCIESMAKPMAIDPMLWDVMELRENNKQPLSFRYWGAFICGNPVLKSKTIDQTGPAVAMPLMIETLDEFLPEILHLLQTTKFSNLAKNPAGIHDNWRLGETVIHSLRLENEPRLAINYAENNTGAFSNSQAITKPKVAGKRHNELVITSIQDETKRSYFRRILDLILKD